MLGFRFLRYGLSSKSADSESTSVHSFTPRLSLQVRQRHNRKLAGSSSKTWAFFDLSSRSHSHAHIQMHTPKQISHPVRTQNNVLFTTWMCRLMHTQRRWNPFGETSECTCHLMIWYPYEIQSLSTNLSTVLNNMTAAISKSTSYPNSY